MQSRSPMASAIGGAHHGAVQYVERHARGIADAEETARCQSNACRWTVYALSTTDFVIAVHDDPYFRRAGWISSGSADKRRNLKITIFGRAGHGARRGITIDPVVIEARTVH